MTWFWWPKSSRICARPTFKYLPAYLRSYAHTYFCEMYAHTYFGDLITQDVLHFHGLNSNTKLVSWDVHTYIVAMYTLRHNYTTEKNVWMASNLMICNIISHVKLVYWNAKMSHDTLLLSHDHCCAHATYIDKLAPCVHTYVRRGVVFQLLIALKSVKQCNFSGGFFHQEFTASFTSPRTWYGTSRQ